MSSGQSPALDPDAMKMTVTLPLEPEKKAKLIALAQAKGLSTDDLVLQAIERMLVEEAETASPKKPTHSLRGLLAKYGPAPSAEEIDQNRAEMFANFPRADF